MTYSVDDIKAIGRRIEKGAWVSNVPNLPGMKLRVRGFGNADYQRKMDEYRRTLSPEEANDPKKQDEIRGLVLNETILTDWDGAIPYSKEIALDLLTDPVTAFFKSAVEYAASVVAQDGHESLEADAKN